MRKKNILVTTFGTTWQIIPELTGFVNRNNYNFYGDHPNKDHFFREADKHNLLSVDEIYIIHSDSKIALDALDKVERWLNDSTPGSLKIKCFSYKGLSELGSPSECLQMSDLIMRTVLYAWENTTPGGSLVLSLTGGRKSMSADIQRASDIFGCSCLVHIADSLRENSKLSSNDYFNISKPLEKEEVIQVNPMIVFGEKHQHSILTVDSSISIKNFPVRYNQACIADTSFIRHINKKLEEADSLLFNNYQEKTRKSSQASFYGLGLLRPQIINGFEKEKIGVSYELYDKDISWLKGLPKAELHCHLGGILDTKEMIEVAETLEPEILHISAENKLFENFLKKIKTEIFYKRTHYLSNLISDSKNLLRKFDHIPEPLAVAAFLIKFKENPDLLDMLIFGPYTENNKYFNVGINKYAQFGDLQGSGLLKHRETLKKACEKLVSKCKNDNIRYCEIRCSPANYATKNFPVNEIYEILRSELSTQKYTKFKLVIIASRHKDLSYLKQHVDFVLTRINNKDFSDFFAGFDVAGDEDITSPRELKSNLERLLRKSVNMTIHAGEGVPVQNIWEAVYELNADRIGHGLTLLDNERLLERFVNRRISVEMCPSSNYQIIGYFDRRYKETSNFEEYPLKKYFDSGIRVTINTDNPGISRTDLSKEYFKAACMTRGGLSKWDILKLIRNGFISAFIPYKQKKSLLLDVEKELVEKI